MTLDLLDMLLVAHFGFHAEFPTWLWVLGVLSTIGTSFSLNRIVKAIERSGN